MRKLYKKIFKKKDNKTKDTKQKKINSEYRLPAI